MSAAPRITLIAAMDRNRLIGADGGMPWHLPGDLRWFRRHTEGKTVLMGRRTFEAIGRALPRRRNLVLSRRDDFSAPGGEVVPGLDAACAQVPAGGELMVIGGAQIYALALPRAGRLLLTRVDAEYAGDTWFPDFSGAHWRLSQTHPQPAADGRPAYRFMTYVRDGG